MMSLFHGIRYNLKGFWLGVRTPKLLLLGIIRFAAVIVITIFCAGLILAYHQEILNQIWDRPQSTWILWLWYVTSWLLSLVLVGLSTIISYIGSQILFSVFIMDQMSRITEKMMTGQVKEAQKIPWFQQFFYLIRQEIPRAIIPLIAILFLTVVGWLTPLGPIITIFLAAIAVIFLAWDNTDLVPARRLEPFSNRFRFLRQTLLFHLGFGIFFLIPILNIFFLSFSPVGATLYYIEKKT
jgi:CysZ protein